jgi:predicted acetyltransferase
MAVACGGWQDDERDVVHRLLAQCFDLSPEMPPLFFRRVGTADVRVPRLDGAVAGIAGLYRMGQWFGGRSVPMGGVAGVGVPPERRGQGVARALMVDVLAHLLRTGTPLPTLLASTQGPYRAVGFEQAAALASATRAFRGPEPWMADRF